MAQSASQEMHGKGVHVRWSALGLGIVEWFLMYKYMAGTVMWEILTLELPHSALVNGQKSKNQYFFAMIFNMTVIRTLYLCLNTRKKTK